MCVTGFLVAVIIFIVGWGKRINFPRRVFSELAWLVLEGNDE